MINTINRPTLSSRPSSRVSCAKGYIWPENISEHGLTYKIPDFRLSKARALSQTDINSRSKCCYILRNRE